VAVAQWDANAGLWNMVSDYKQSDQRVVAKLIAEDSAAYAAENNITPNCN
jgi:branched-chain amino acid transport system substrate-binding protein